MKLISGCAPQLKAHNIADAVPIGMRVSCAFKGPSVDFTPPDGHPVLPSLPEQLLHHPCPGPSFLPWTIEATGCSIRRLMCCAARHRPVWLGARPRTRKPPALGRWAALYLTGADSDRGGIWAAAPLNGRPRLPRPPHPQPLQLPPQDRG